MNSELLHIHGGGSGDANKGIPLPPPSMEQGYPISPRIRRVSPAASFDETGVPLYNHFWMKQVCPLAHHWRKQGYPPSIPVGWNMGINLLVCMKAGPLETCTAGTFFHCSRVSHLKKNFTILKKIHVRIVFIRVKIQKASIFTSSFGHLFLNR